MSEKDNSTLEDIKRAVQELKATADKTDLVLFGDKFDQDNPGFFAIMMEQHRDYYGDKKTRRLGTKDMILTMWELRWKITGAALALGVIGAFLGWAITQLISLKH